MSKTTLHQNDRDPRNRYSVRRLPTSSPDYHDAIEMITGEVTGRRAEAPKSNRLDRVVGSDGPALDLHRCSKTLLFGAYPADVPVRRSRLVSASLAIELPGATSLIMVPDAAPDHEVPPEATLATLKALVPAEFARGQGLLQALVSPSHDTQPRLFRDAGFSFLTRLLYLDLRCRAGLEPVNPRPLCCCDKTAINWIPYTSSMHALFLSALELTYVESLDCPGLAGLRSAPDILAGHRATGDTGSKLWWMAEVDHSPVGVLLLSHHRRAASVEVVYMGVVPSARGRGVGDALLFKAIRETQDIAADSLALAVDRANTPARRLYARFGFTLKQRRDAWIIASSGAVT